MRSIVNLLKWGKNLKEITGLRNNFTKRVKGNRDFQQFFRKFNEIKQTKIEKDNFNGNRSRITISQKKVGYWMLGGAGLVYGMIILGGLTRLSESGLSITEWKPITGVLYPLSDQRWEQEFLKYRESPEFKILKTELNLEEFKKIYTMEWVHRMLGRGLGIYFVLPALYFWKRRILSQETKKRVIQMGGLIGLQGAIGWWMVKSGLDETEIAKRHTEPTVSQYRLSVHLGMGIALYLGMIWNSIKILNHNRWIDASKSDSKKIESVFAALKNPSLKGVRIMGYVVLGLAFLTSLSGGFVAGLNAGLIYDMFPYMGKSLVPSKRELFSPIYARNEDKSDLWRNIFDNPVTVQLLHRIFASTLFFTILASHIYFIKKKKIIPKQAHPMIHATMGLVTLQVLLGVATLHYNVPTLLASLHQTNSLALLTVCLVFCAFLRRPKKEVIDLILSLSKKS